MTTPSTTRVSAGDVVLVVVPFSNQSGAKLRPAVVVSSDRFHAERIDAIIVPITSSAGDDRAGDYQIRNWRDAGLRRPSSIKATPYTVDRRGIRRQLGRLASVDATNVGRALRSVLGL